MKKNIGLIILIIIISGITAFLAYTIVSKQSLKNVDFNIKKGDIINFEEKSIKATVLNVASTLCDNKDTCIDEGEVEVSLKIEYAGNTSNYKLQTKSNPKQRIKLSNYYLTLDYKDKELVLDVIEK